MLIHCIFIWSKPAFSAQKTSGWSISAFCNCKDHTSFLAGLVTSEACATSYCSSKRIQQKQCLSPLTGSGDIAVWSTSNFSLSYSFLGTSIKALWFYAATGWKKSSENVPKQEKKLMLFFKVTTFPYTQRRVFCLLIYTYLIFMIVPSWFHVISKAPQSFTVGDLGRSSFDHWR